METLALGLIPTPVVDFLFYTQLGVIALISIYILNILLHAAYNKRPGAKMLTTGFLVFFLSVVNDTLYVEGLLPTNHYIGLGLAFFILAEIAINEKFIRAEEQLKVEHEQLVHADKLAALGTLVASVAHEVNNPNHIIKLNITEALADAQTLRALLAELVPRPEQLQLGALNYPEFIANFDASLQAIRKSSDAITQIVLDLKTYAQHKKDEPAELLDINQLIQDVSRLLAPLIKSATNRFTMNLAPGLPAFYGQPQRLKQVLVNLLQNACQALTHKQQGICITSTYRAETNTLVLAIRDEGQGMDKETQRRIFEPFFTKKQSEGGTGLGLSIARQIIGAHGGTIRFESEPGRGTTVSVNFILAAGET
jgi:polar amino acid transport system substrate-binding protein